MKRLAVASVGLVLVLLVGIAVVRWANEPVSQTMVLPPQPAESDTAQQLFDGPYFSFMLPARYKLDTWEQSGVRMERSAIEQNGDRLRIGVVTAPLSTASYEDIADYKLRTAQTLQYERVFFDALPTGSEAFATTDTSTERQLTVFVRRADRYVSVTASGEADTEKLRAVLTAVLRTWTWR